MAMGSNLLSTFGLPSSLQHGHDNCITADYIRETSYDTEQLAAFINENEPRMLLDQKQAFNTIMARVNHAQGGLFFLDAPGGTGKTFRTNLILAKLRHKKVIALAVASSGIAATLLDGGRTAHSAFKLPLDLAKRDNPTCNIARGNAKAQLLKECQLIVWDEATMSHKGAFEALNTTSKISVPTIVPWEALHSFSLETSGKLCPSSQEESELMKSMHASSHPTYGASSNVSVSPRT